MIGRGSFAVGNRVHVGTGTKVWEIQSFWQPGRVSGSWLAQLVDPANTATRTSVTLDRLRPARPANFIQAIASLDEARERRHS